MVSAAMHFAMILTALAHTAPGYELRYYPTRQIACSFSSVSNVTGMSVKEYVFYQLLPEPTPRQHVTMDLAHPTGATGFTRGGERLPLVFLRQVFARPQNGASVGYELAWRGQLCRTVLERVAAGRPRPKVPDLTPAQRKSYTERTDVYDYDSPVVKGWLKRAGLLKAADESDLDFGRRVFLAMSKTFAYGGPGNVASRVVTDKSGVCAGLSIAFCAAMRASGVPCRVLSAQQVGLGGNFGGSEKGHSTSEFFCQGIGWVPCDLTPACSLPNGPDEEEALQFFAQDRGDTLMMFNGASDFTVDTVTFGSSQPQPPANYRSQYASAVPAESSQFWGLMYTGTEEAAKYTSDDHFYARVWTDPAAYERALPDGGPAASAAHVAGFSVWRDNSGWHIRGTTDGRSHVFQMSVWPEMAVGQGQAFSPGESEQASVAVGYPAVITSVDQDVPVPAGAVALRFQLTMDGRDMPSLVSIGGKGTHPAMQPFTMAVR